MRFLSSVISACFIQPRCWLNIPSVQERSKVSTYQRRITNGISIPEVESSDFSSDFISSHAWGTHPILLRGAFKEEATSLKSLTDSGSDSGSGSDFDSPWPCWDDVMMLASDEDAESRLITSNILNEKFELEIGPIDESQIQNMRMSASTLIEDDDSDSGSDSEKWTVVVNDVDRFHPELSEWMSQTFSMIPRWRRDDGQISLSDAGGGIGAHVDDYDVFLIQMAGTRLWEVGKRKILHREEIEGLKPGLDVRVLDFWQDETDQGLVDALKLDPGDVLYLPPRFGHCGTAISDGCMTLSVGLRAPSAKEMLTKLTDQVTNALDGKILDRYTDSDLFKEARCSDQINGLNSDVKLKGKALLKDAINEWLDDESLFDEFFGKLVTESKRLRYNYPLSLDDLEEECKEELGVWGDAKKCVQAVMDGDGALYCAEGISFAYSMLDTENGKVCRLFVDGTMRELLLEAGDTTSTKLVQQLVNEGHIQRCQDLLERGAKPFAELLEELVRDGYLYGATEEIEKP